MRRPTRQGGGEDRAGVAAGLPRRYRIGVGGRTLRLLGPGRPEALLDDPAVQRRFDEDQYMPYWAEPWPASVMLAEHLAGALEPDGRPVLELGAGLGVGSIAMSLAGHRMVATDYEPQALVYMRRSARLNGACLERIELLDWRGATGESFDTIVAADVLYERRNHAPLAAFLAAHLAPGGRGFVCDPDRGSAAEFGAAVLAAGLGVARVAVQTPAAPPLGPGDHRTLHGTVYQVTPAR